MPKQTFFNLPEGKKATVLDAAIDEFAERGYSLASVSRIVAEAGIAKGSFYQYFEDKDDLYCYIFDEMIAKRKMQVYDQEEKRLEDLSLTGFLRVVFRRQVREFSERPKLYKIALELIQLAGEPIYQRIMKPYAGQVDSYFLTYIQHEINQGEIDGAINTKLLNFMLLSLGQYIMNIIAESENAVPSVALIDRLVDDLEYILANGIYVKADG